MHNKLVISLVLFLLLVSASAFSQEKAEEPKEAVIALVGGTLIDGNGGAPLPGATVIIKGEKIEAAGPAAEVAIPEGAEKIDVSGKWILPGFIDCHIHITYPFDNDQYFTYDDSLGALRGLHILNLYLKSGVTAVRDVGSPIEPQQALLQAMALGYVDTSRLYPCGQIITVTGGHGDGLYGDGERLADGPWDFRKAVREMQKAGFRHIKISPTYTLEEVQAAVDEARTLGLMITSHGGGVSDTHPPTMVEIAVRGGVDCIEHPPMIGEGVLEMMAEKGVHSVPTMSVYRKLFEDGFMPEVLKQRGWTLKTIEDFFHKARELKLVMGIGTDYCGGALEYPKLYPGAYFTEMKYYVELGASPMETIVCASKNGAIVLGMEDKLGTVEAGKLADIQVLPGNPLEKFDVLGKPEMVLVGGKVHRFRD
ncbi:MAG TPA: amidohydrolase family protein [Acidobacteriota bacterium]|nr:amidohydrolase family protein [Acidobacteriota bacterium]